MLKLHVCCFKVYTPHRKKRDLNIIVAQSFSFSIFHKSTAKNVLVFAKKREEEK